ncbi:MAG: aldehyde ferredoxin oxidoreductase C-terminal domain-containing protein [Candidatus Bathyarchaeota archaeon]|nr:aldehyde ferredoxin oxidoreductase C-terminal domain-containing protein [Candidatus Bathyarchaeota archaeon]
MIPGYAGKFLEVDLFTKNIKETTFSDDILKDYIGGRGLAAKILWDRLGSKWSEIDPLEPENILLFLTGPLTGFFPGGRICVSGKSPQSNGVVGSTVAGEFGVELKCAGYDGIMVSGASEEPVYLFVKDSEVEIRKANHIWGEDAKQTISKITKESRELLRKRFPRKGEWKEPSILYIGPAGENKVRTAVVAAKWTHAAGYGGYGAVMGSKKLKAIAVKGTGPLPEVADMNSVKRLMQNVCKDVYESELWRRWGTGAAGYEVGAKTSSEPVRNWQEEWHDEKSFGVDQFENRVWIKPYWGDFGCPTTCLKIAVVKTGKFKGAITDNPDYELQAYLGPNLGIFTPEENVFLASLIDDLGLCGIQTGNVLGFAAELFQRGILTREDLDGLELSWGKAEAFATLARKIAFREGIGNLLAEGTYRAALKIGEMKKKDVLVYAVQSKGIAIGAHGIRSGKDYPETYSYACSVQGGDHTSTACFPLHDFRSELMMTFNDSAVYCYFNIFGVPRNLKFEFYKAVTGIELTQEEWLNPKALRILQLQRAMLLLGGPDLKWNPKTHDANPPRFYEPLPSGPYKGRTVDKADVEKEIANYYEAVGWDENGIPKTEVLRKLGLNDVDKALEKLH